MSPSSRSTSDSAGGDLGVRQDADLLALRDEELDLLEFLKFGY